MGAEIVTNISRALHTLYWGIVMLTRTTTDPVTLDDVPDPEHHACVYEGNASDDYVAEGRFLPFLAILCIPPYS